MEENTPNQQQQSPKKPNNHMVMAIITTVLPIITCTFFSLPAGIVSIVFASKVNSQFNSGNVEGAEKSSKYAKIAWIVALGILAAQIIFFIITIAVSDGSFIEEIEKEIERQQSLQQ